MGKSYPLGRETAKTRHVVPAYYNGIEWEAKTSNRACTFDESFARLRKAGYERHALPSEILFLHDAGLLTDVIENAEREIQSGKLGASHGIYAESEIECAVRSRDRWKKEGNGLEERLMPVYNDLKSRGATWVSMAFEVQGNTLIVYKHPEGLVCGKRKDAYVKEGFTCQEEKQFRIDERWGNRSVTLNYFSNSFVNYLFGRNYSQLPLRITSAPNLLRIPTFRIRLPADGTIWPVAHWHGPAYRQFSLVGHHWINHYSRGVRNKTVL